MKSLLQYIGADSNRSIFGLTIPSLAEVLATFFLLFLLLDRLGGAWETSAVYALSSALALAALLIREPWRDCKPFLFAFALTMGWMLFRDVSTGSNWAAGERMLKSVIFLLGMLACTRMELPSLLRSLRLAVLAGAACFISYIGIDQIVNAWASPLEFAMRGGFATDINRNAFALPLALLTIWSIAICVMDTLRVSTCLLTLFLLSLLVVNGGRGSMAALAAATLIMTWIVAPRRALQLAAFFICTGLLTLLIWPEYLGRGEAGLMSFRDVIWSGVIGHLPEQGWIGAGRGYFRAVISPELTPYFPDGYLVPHAHNIYLDWLLAYGVVGFVLLLFAGTLLARRLMGPHGKNRWLLGSAGILVVSGIFSHEPHDPMMIMGLLMIPSLILSLRHAWTGRNS